VSKETSVKTHSGVGSLSGKILHFQNILTGTKVPVATMIRKRVKKEKASLQSIEMA
jgi:hypothetical protein